MGCGAGLLLGLGGSGVWAFAGGVEGVEVVAMASTGSTVYPAGAGGVKPKPGLSLWSSSIGSMGAAARGSAETGQAIGGSAMVESSAGWASAAEGVVALEVGATAAISASIPPHRWARGTRSRGGAASAAVSIVV